MKKTILFLILLHLPVIMIFTGCEKEGDAPVQTEITTEPDTGEEDNTGTDITPDDTLNGGDPQFTMDDIEYWTGTGKNRAALVIEWHDGKQPDALVWGYRWDGNATGDDMLTEIVKADPLLFAVIEKQKEGTIIGGFGYNSGKKENPYLVINNGSDQAKYAADGFVEIKAANFDGITYSNSSGHWQSGWYKGYWSYFVKNEWGDTWEYSNQSLSLRKLKDGSWDGWSFLDDMNEYSGRPLGNKFTPALPPRVSS